MSNIYLVKKLNAEEAPKNSDCVIAVFDNLEKAEEFFKEQLNLMKEDYEENKNAKLYRENEYRYIYEDDEAGYYSVLELEETEMSRISAVVF